MCSTTPEDSSLRRCLLAEPSRSAAQRHRTTFLRCLGSKLSWSSSPRDDDYDAEHRPLRIEPAAPDHEPFRDDLQGDADGAAGGGASPDPSEASARKKRPGQRRNHLRARAAGYRRASVASLPISPMQPVPVSCIAPLAPACVARAVSPRQAGHVRAWARRGVINPRCCLLAEPSRSAAQRHRVTILRSLGSQRSSASSHRDDDGDMDARHRRHEHARRSSSVVLRPSPRRRRRRSRRRRTLRSVRSTRRPDRRGTTPQSSAGAGCRMSVGERSEPIDILDAARARQLHCAVGPGLRGAGGQPAPGRPRASLGTSGRH